MQRPLSMTSFGRGEFSRESRSWTVEVKSVNHRFLDLKIKLPQKYSPLEEKVRQEIANHFSRGHVNVILTLTDTGAGATRLLPNLELARDYHRCLTTIQQELGLAGPPDLPLLASFREIITPVEVEENIEESWPDIRQALVNALENCARMRANEGATLKEDLLQRLAKLEATVQTIEAHLPELLKSRETALAERLSKLLQNVELDPMRLAQEVAILADKTDVTEEIVRLRSHSDQFRNFLAMDEPAGRRLDFLLQEFLREINTMASKISDAPTMHLTVEMKNELEKMREQVQNLE